MIYYAVFILLLACCLGLLYIIFRQDPSVEKLKEEVGCLTPNQRRLYHALVFHGYQVRTNYPCGQFVIALALPGQRIAIECESKVIDFSTRKCNPDIHKEQYLKNKGWIVLRFTGAMIKGNTGKVLRKIEDTILKAQAH